MTTATEKGPFTIALMTAKGSLSCHPPLGVGLWTKQVALPWCTGPFDECNTYSMSDSMMAPLVAQDAMSDSSTTAVSLDAEPATPPLPTKRVAAAANPMHPDTTAEERRSF